MASILEAFGTAPVMPKILHMPKRKEQSKGKEETPLQRPVLPDSNEERASISTINKWISLADAALSRKTA